MDFTRKMTLQIEALEVQVQICNLRKKLFHTCIQVGIGRTNAERIASGTFFGNGDDFNLTAKQYQLIDDLLTKIANMQQVPPCETLLAYT